MTLEVDISTCKCLISQTRQVNHSYTCLRVTPVRFSYTRGDAAHFEAINVINNSDISVFSRKPYI